MSTARGFVATGKFAGDDGRAQLSFGQVVGGLNGLMLAKGEQMVLLFAQAVGHGFFQRIGSRGLEQPRRVLFERPAHGGLLLGRQIGSRFLQRHGRLVAEIDGDHVSRFA